MKPTRIAKVFFVMIFAFAVVSACLSAGIPIYNNAAHAETITSVNGYVDFTYNGSYYTFTPTYAGYYKIELWGAQGGTVNASYPGGKGGYTYGVILLGAGESVYVYVGESGGTRSTMSNDTVLPGTFNGGGSSGSNWSSNNTPGGGATDVRLVAGSWNNFDSLKSRIMVAGGGGGANYNTNSGTYPAAGGNGGGLYGAPGTENGKNPDTCTAPGGGSQTSGGTAGLSTNGGVGVAGGFGFGGGVGNYNFGGGGGGGFYGGGGATYGSEIAASGGGGSSYISGYDGCSAIEYASNANSISHTADSLHYSGKMFTDAGMTAGNNTGNGRAKITFLRKTDNVLQVNTGVDQASVQSGVSVDLSRLFAVTAHSSGASITYRVNGSTVSPSYTFTPGTYTVSCSATLGGKTSTRSVTVFAGAATYNFGYTGNAQSFTAPVSGYYYVQLWGAQGGNMSSADLGGYGAKTSGLIYLNANATVYVYVGQGGYGFQSDNPRFNGGGANVRYSDTYWGQCGGGGATDIRLVNNGTNWGAFDGLKSRIMVAAGGGGGNNGDGGSGDICGGHGGGLTGLPGVNGNTGTPTQTSGYAFGAGGSNTSRGGNADTGSGGGGYYGGNASDNSNGGGAGGSSFISGHPLCNAIDRGSEANNLIHTGQSIHYSGYYFTQTAMEAGVYGSTAANSAQNGYASITCVSKLDNTSAGVTEFNFTGSAQIYTVPADGWYSLELWGAQGGNCSTNNLGGKGGYTSGKIYLTAGTTLYVYVGEYGYNPGNSAVFFNGGGAGLSSEASYVGKTGGGGATDIRLVGGSWDNATGLRSRIMVAGGGGGGGDGNAYAPNTGENDKIAGGAGGNLTGGRGYAGDGSYPSTTRSSNYAQGGGQTGTVAYFGKGGNNNSNGAAGHDAGAGGGGYFGGYGGINTNCGGGGGSSYISGYPGCRSVASASSDTITESAFHYSGYYFEDSKMEAGVRSGAGLARITRIVNFSSPSSLSSGSVSGTTTYKGANTNEAVVETVPNLVSNKQRVTFPTALTSSPGYSSYKSYVYAGYETGGGVYRFSFDNTYKSSYGTYTVSVYASALGYSWISQLYTNIYCDTTAPASPTLTRDRAAGSSGYFYSSVTVTFSAGTDGQSGFNRYSYKIDNGSWTNGGSASVSSSLSSGTENKTLYVRVYDNNENYTEVQSVISFDRNTYSITYHNVTTGFTNPNPTGFHVETPTITLQNITRTGFTFGGYYTDAGFTNSASNTIPKDTRANKVYYVKFTLNQPSVSVPSSGSTTYGNSYNLTSTASHENGSASLSYQWQIKPPATGSFSNIGGATAASYNYATTAAGDFSFDIVVTASLDGYTSSKTSGVFVLSVGRKNITVTATAVGKTYGDTLLSVFPYTVNAGGLVGSDALSGALACATLQQAAGSYPVTQGTLNNDNNPNYNITFVSANYVIARKSITATATAIYKTYGDTLLSFFGYTLSNDLKNGDTGLSGALACPTLTQAAGSYPIIQGTLTNDNNPNYNITFVPANYVIARKNIAVTATAISKVYGDPLVYSYGYALSDDLRNGDTGLSGELACPALTQAAGSYAITAGTLTNDNNPNYNITFVGANYVITKKPVTVTAGAVARIYGEPLLSDFPYTASGLVGDDTLSGAPACPTLIQAAGSYPMTAGTLNNTNYEITFIPADYVIARKVITVQATEVNKVYGDTLLAVLPYAVNEGGLVGSDTLQGALACATLVQAAGSYEITQGTLDNDRNPDYDITFYGAYYNTARKPITVTVTPIVRIFGQAPLDVSYSYTLSDDLVNGDTGLTGELICPALTENRGVYPILQGTLTDGNNANYAITFVGGDYTIGTYQIPVNASLFTKTYGDADPILEEPVAGVEEDILIVVYTRAPGNVAGTYDLVTIRLKEENENYTVAFTGDGGKDKFVIEKRVISVTALDTGHIFGDPDATLPYTTENMVTGDTLNGSLIRGSGDTAGVYRILQGTLSHPDYEIASYTEAVYTVYKKPVTVTALNTGHIFGDDAVPLTYSNTALVTGYPLSVTLIREAEIRAGQYPILAANDLEADNPNYDITFEQGLYTIARRPVSVFAYSRSSYYGDPEAELTYIAYGTSPLAELTGALVRDRAELPDAGVYDILQGTLDNEHNPDYDIIYTKNTYTIHKRNVSIVPVVFTKVYGEDDPALIQTLEGAYGEPYTVTYRRSQPNVNSVGTYSLVEITAVGSNNYAASIAPGAGDGKFVITRKTITVTANDVHQIYGEADQPLTYLANTLAYDETTLNGSLIREAGTHWREEGYAVSQGSVTNANNPNYDIVFAPGTYYIDKRPVKLTADSKFQVYGQPETTLTYRVTAGSLVEGDMFSGAIIREEGNTVREGGYAITAGDIGNPDYEITFVNGVYTVTPADVFVSADQKTITYGEPDVALTYRITAGLVGDDTLSGEITRVPGSAANEAGYDILAGTLGNPNYTVRFTSAKYIILRRAITLTAEPKTQVYGDSPVPLTYLLTEGSLVNDDTLTGALTRDPGNDYREEGYGIRIGTVGNGNYSITFVSARYMITRRPITVTAEDKTQVYGDDAEPLTYRITEGNLAEGDVLYSSLSRSGGNNVGAYAIQLGSLNNNNYAISFAGATYTIVKRPITVTADNITVPYGETPVPTYTVSSLAYNDSLHGAPVLAFQSDIYPAGEYDIVQGTLQNANNPNYLITFVPGICTVSRRNIVVALLEQSVPYGAASSTPDQTAFVATDAISGNPVDARLVQLSITREPGMFIGAYALHAVCGNPNYEATIVPAVYKINKLTPRITVDATDVVIPYTGIPYSIAASVSSKVAPIFTVDGVAVENAFTEVGTYIVTVSGEGTDICLPPPVRTVKITILPVALETGNGSVTSSDGYSGNSNFKIVTASPYAGAGSLLSRNERFAATYDIIGAASASTLRLQVPAGITTPTVKVIVTEKGVTRALNLTQFEGYVTFEVSGNATVSFVTETHPAASYIPVILSVAAGLIIIILGASAIRKRYRY